TRTLIRSYALQGKPVNEILSLVNNALATDNRLAMFSTCFLGIMELKTGTVEYCNAAHSQPFVILPNTDVYVLDTRGGMALGMLENMTYRVSTITMQPGMTLVLYTDGITDATNIRREMYGTERIGLTLASNAALAPQELMMALLSSVDQFVAGEEQADDIGIVILRYTGSTTP
ncbi:MAG: serine/threonine-protein phosphatase, partial [Candidatus Kapabacteria bacterium]|nr:serine/threonine-protein phosphatase [Candidatus Kapabacteria bacterium]